MSNNRLTADQIKYAESVSNPRTGADLLLALQNPYSKAHQELMNLIDLNEAIHIIVHRMIEQLNQENFLASKQERDAILKYIIATALAEQEKTQQQLPPKIHINEDELARLSLLEFKERLDAYTTNIHTFENENKQLSQRLDELKEEAKENNKQWEDYSQKTADTFLAQLAEKQIPIVLADGSKIDQTTEEGKIKAKEFMNPILNKPSPLKKLEIILPPVEKCNKSADPSIPPAPPPPAYSNAPLMAQMDNCMTEFKYRVACAGKDSGAILKSFENKDITDAVKLLPGVDMTLRPALGKKISPKENEQTNLIQKAMDIYAEKSEKTKVLQHNEGAIKRLQATLDAEQAIYDKRLENTPSFKP